MSLNLFQTLICWSISVEIFHVKLGILIRTFCKPIKIRYDESRSYKNRCVFLTIEWVRFHKYFDMFNKIFVAASCCSHVCQIWDVRCFERNKNENHINWLKYGYLCRCTLAFSVSLKKEATTFWNHTWRCQNYILGEQKEILKQSY
jgi:hypothetical protein